MPRPPKPNAPKPPPSVPIDIVSEGTIIGSITPAPIAEQTTGAKAVADDVPMKPGYYWAKWKIPAEGTHEGADLCPSDSWELVQVNANHVNWHDDPAEDESLSVSVPGVRETQWRDCFFWGDFALPLSPAQPARAPGDEITKAKALLAAPPKFSADDREWDSWREQCVRQLEAVVKSALPTHPDPGGAAAKVLADVAVLETAIHREKRKNKCYLAGEAIHVHALESLIATARASLLTPAKPTDDAAIVKKDGGKDASGD